MVKKSSKTINEETILAEIEDLKVVINDQEKVLKSLIGQSAADFDTAIAIRDVAQEIADAHFAVKQKEIQLKCIRSGML